MNCYVIPCVFIRYAALVFFNSALQRSSSFSDIAGRAFCAWYLKTAPARELIGEGSFTLVSTSRRVVEGLWATVMLWGLKIRAILSDVPLAYGIVAITLLSSSVSDLSVV